MELNGTTNKIYQALAKQTIPVSRMQSLLVLFYYCIC